MGGRQTLYTIGFSDDFRGGMRAPRIYLDMNATLYVRQKADCKKNCLETGISIGSSSSIRRLTAISAANSSKESREDCPPASEDLFEAISNAFDNMSWFSGRCSSKSTMI